MKKILAATFLVVILVLALVGFAARNWVSEQVFYITGEEVPLPQLSGTALYLLTWLQPPLNTADLEPVQHAGLIPYGINTFLQNEVEPEKRERSMQMVSDAGFKWIRQEFPWEDIEIHGKGDFEDRRNEAQLISAWVKYDQIVDLAERYDIQIMARLSNPPAWSRVVGNEVGTYAPPDNYADYGDFVEAVARRYKGRIHVYQLWNEPNIYPEWGEYPINATQYVQLLKEGYTRIKTVDPQAIVVMGALAATIELDRERTIDPETGGIVSPGGLYDVLFLQQIYDAGGGDYFDVLAMQGYGLWSGPYDRRMQPRVLNFSRPRYIRDVMVRNGDAHKPIWLSEMGWNSAPPNAGIPLTYGSVSPGQQGRYANLAYQRMQQEWPWLGVGFYWFLKQADDRELQDGNPQYYFHLVKPDFTPSAAYLMLSEALKVPPVLYRGFHQEDHWALIFSENWSIGSSDRATLGKVVQSQSAGATVQFTFEGSSLHLVTLPHQTGGLIQIQINDDTPRQVTIPIANEPVNVELFSSLFSDEHDVSITVLGDAPVRIDGFIVNNRPVQLLSVAGSFTMLAAVTIGFVALRRRKGEEEQPIGSAGAQERRGARE